MTIKRGKIMDNDLILEIDNVGPISHAKIDIGKINIIGGKNSSGKSTSSKLLYCFLKANSSIDDELIFDNVYPLFEKMNDNTDLFYSYVSTADFKKIKNIFRRFSDSFRGRKTKFFINEFYEFSEQLDDIIIRNKNKFNQKDPRWNYFQSNYQSMKDYVSNTLDNPKKLYISSLKQLIDSEFNIREPADFGGRVTLYLENANIKDEICFKNYSFDHKSSYPIDNIFYLDSFSILDDDINGLLNTEHIQSLINSLYEYYHIRPGIDDEMDKIIKRLESKINHLIGGEVVSDNRKENIFRSNNNISSPMKNTASGIKQIGIVQRLLSNHKLTSNSFLIIDEPEVNLHPEWQVIFAKILILIVKDLDMKIYINTHSPMFIEALILYSEANRLLDETNVFLTEEIENSKHIFKKIDSKDMGAIYENLSRPYDDLDELKSKLLLNFDQVTLYD